MARRRYHRIGEVAKLERISPRTVDYYTQLGLLTPITRSKGNYRLYDEEARERIRRIKLLQEQHVPLAEIRQRLAAPPVSAESAAHLEHLNELVREFERETSELAAARPQLQAECSRDGDARLAISRAASSLLQHALVLSQVLASVIEDTGIDHLPL